MTRPLLGLLALSALAFGAASLAEARTPSESRGIPTWSYLCFEGSSATQVMQRANEAGARGWEMVSAAPGDSGSVWCFRQARWARPEGTSD